MSESGVKVCVFNNGDTLCGGAEGITFNSDNKKCIIVQLDITISELKHIVDSIFCIKDDGSPLGGQLSAHTSNMYYRRPISMKNGDNQWVIKMSERS